MNVTDRFAPPLMYAFREAFRKSDSRKQSDERDTQGERVIASRRASSRSSVGEGVLKQELTQDIGVLLNTVNFGSCENLAEFPHVAKSILNFGFADLTAISIDEGAVDGVAAELRTALTNYEPRLVADSITIEREMTVDTSVMQIRFQVTAEMRCSPVDVPVQFIADFEIDSGKLRVSRL